MASDSSRQYPIGVPSSTNALNHSSFAHYYPTGGESSIQSSAILVDPYMGNALQTSHSAEYSYWQSYARQAAAHSEAAASIAYGVPQYPVYAVGPPNDEPYEMPHGMNAMLNAASQMYPPIPTYHQPTSMDGAALMAAESCIPADTRNYKKVQCRHFAAGMCVRGATCGFKHGENDNGDALHAMVLPRMVPMVSHLNAGKPFRVVPCQHWLVGNCRKGAFCTFRHEFPAVNPTVSSSTIPRQMHSPPESFSNSSSTL
jgi:hypothetical protein